MANTPMLPAPQSYQNLLTDMLSSYALSTGISSPFIGSANLSFFEVAALSIARASGDVFQTLLNSSIQYATGPNLQLIASEFQIIPTESAVATGVVNVVDTSFQVVSTSIYPGANPVNIGSTVIYVGSLTGFPASGSIFVGRGTNDSEGPIPYSSTAPIGNYFQINLSTPTTRYHNLGESVILSQGSVRTIPVNTIVLAPSNGLVPSQQYTVTQTASILPGANTVTNVPITALLPGSAGNVSANTITQFASPPFPNATVTNPIPTSNGTDPETDDALRTQILQKLSSIGLGTATAIENSLIGVSATTEAATITSVNLVNNLNGSSTVYIAAGNTPYEAKTAGVAIEHIVDVAVGGEQFFQLATGGTQAPVAEAFVQSTDASPFAVSGGMVLAVTVGGITTEHTFLTTDFQAPGAATAYEIAASINADSSLNFQCTTAGGGTFVVLSATSLTTHEGIQVTVPSSPTAVNANNFLGFPTTLNNTLWLYKNDTLLSEDGNTASVFTQDQGLWSNTITNGDTLILTVDNTAAITYTFLNSDFIATGLYTTVNATNSLASWVEVFNNKLTGVTASIVGTQIELTSNSGYTTRAEISIDPSSTLVSKDMFSLSVGLSSDGNPADYVLDRNTAQFQLAVALKAGDNLTAGTENTKGTVTSAIIAGGSVTLASEGYIWIAIDEPVIPIATGATSGSFVSVSTTGSTVHYKSNVSSAFSKVLPGDYVIIWSSQLPAADRLEGRVHSITTTSNADDTLNILVTAAEAAAIVPQTNTQIVGGFVVARMNYAPQKFNAPAGTNTIDYIASYLQSQTDSLTFGVSLEEYLTVNTVTLNASGSVSIVTFDGPGSQLNFTAGQTSNSSYPLIAYQDSVATYMPSFFHSTLSADSVTANPPDSFLTTMTSSISLAGRDPDEILTFINPYGTTLEVTTGNITNTTFVITNIPSTTGFKTGMTITGAGIQAGTIISSVDSATQVHISLAATATTVGVTITLVGVIDDEQPENEVVQETIVPTTTVNFTLDPDVRRLRLNDRFFTSAPLSFGNNDNMVVVMDNNFVNYVFDIPLYRHALTNTTYSVDSTGFNAYDSDFAPTGNFATSFGPGFSFNNYKLLMQAKHILKSTTNQSSILFRSVQWGASGEKVIVSYIYNGSAPAITSSVTVTNTVNVVITVPAATTANQIVTYVTANLAAWVTAVAVNDGTGGSPGTGIITGVYAYYTGIIAGTSTAVTLTAVTAGPNGNIINLTFNGSININTAINNWNSANPSNQIVLTSGNGAQIPSNVGIAQPSGGVNVSAQLLDGINWILYSNISPNLISGSGNTTIGSNIITGVYPNSGILPGATIAGTGIPGGTTVVMAIGPNITLSANATATNTATTLTFINTASPQFVLKKPLAYPVDGTGYAFNNGETVILSPTTVDQVYKFMDVLPVTGLSTAALINPANRDSELEFSSYSYGSQGFVEIVGGSANGYAFPLQNGTLNIDNHYAAISAIATASSNVLSGQWFFLQAATAQKKLTNFGNNSDVTTVPNSPLAGQTTVSVSGQLSTQLYFGEPRDISGLTGLKFRVEKQGTFVCFSYVDSTSTPQYLNVPVDFSVIPEYTFTVSSANATVGATYTNNGNTFTVVNTISSGITLVTTGTGAPALSGHSSLINSASNFSLLAYSTITNTGSSVITGDVGLTPGTSITPGAWTLIGTEYVADVTAVTAQTDASNAYTSLAAHGGYTPISSTLDGQTLTAGYYSESSGTFNLAQSGPGTLTLNGSSTDVFVFKAASTLVTGAGGIPTITLTGGALASNVYWLVGSSATINSGNTGTFEGNVIAQASVTVTLGGTVNGSLVALTGAVTLSAATNANAIPGSPSGVLTKTSGTGDATIDFSAFSVSAGNLSVALVAGTNDAIYTALSGGLNFSELSIGGLVTITGLAEPGNNGTFMVSGVTATTLQVTNSSAVVDATETYTGSTFAATTGVQEGDSVIVGAPFSAGNQGTYRVIRSWNDSFWIKNPDYVEEEQTLTSNSLTFYPYEATIPGDQLVISGTAFGANSAGTYPVLSVVSPNEIVVQGLISSTNVFTFTVSSANATAGATYTNNGQTFTITNTIAAGTTLISTGTGLPLSSGTLTKASGIGDATITFSAYSQNSINLTGLIPSFYINEGTPYTGYKHVYLVAMQPGTTNMNEILFDTVAQYEKMNQSAGVEVNALQKLEFPVTIDQGLDGYKYNTGLIQQANRVVYGDPTSSDQFPGVAAAGSDIFIKPPLVLVIKDIAIEVRLATGAPFSSIVQQVQSNVTALINSNPIGQSIAISSIISVCTTIPGIISVAISSPVYSDTSDLIVVQPNEQTYVIDSTSISVSLIQ